MLNVVVNLAEIRRGAEAFRKMPERLQRHLLDSMQESEIELLRQISDRTPVRTGNLRRSETADLPPTPNENGLGYIGRVLIGAEYAAAVEFGKRGAEQVRAHERSEAFGRPTRPFMVRAHVRRANQPERPYVRPGLAAARERIQALHVRAVERTAADMREGA